MVIGTVVPTSWPVAVPAMGIAPRHIAEKSPDTPLSVWAVIAHLKSPQPLSELADEVHNPRRDPTADDGAPEDVADGAVMDVVF
jgi:hypothetical protein